MSPGETSLFHADEGSLLGDSAGRNSKEKGIEQGSVSVSEAPMPPLSIFRGSGAQTADSPAT